MQEVCGEDTCSKCFEELMAQENLKAPKRPKIKIIWKHRQFSEEKIND